MPDTVPYHLNKSSVPTGSMLSSQKKGGQIYYVRHGQTHFNSADRIRGWNDIPLDEDGKKEAHKVGKQLKGKIESIVTSDLKRTAETADIISQESGVKVQSREKGLRPWNLGEFTGKDVVETLDKLKHYAKDEPDKSMKDGESFNTFKRRYITTIERIVAQNKGKDIAVVSHHRGDRVLDAWEKDGKKDFDVDVNTFFTKGMEPGTFRVISMDKLTK